MSEISTNKRPSEAFDDDDGVGVEAVAKKTKRSHETQSNGRRFMEMKTILDDVSKNYTRQDAERRTSNKGQSTKLRNRTEEEKNKPFLHFQLSEFVKSHTATDETATRTGKMHRLVKQNRQHEDHTRRTLPNNILRAMQTADPNFQQTTFEMTWLVCYLNDKVPDVALAGWEGFDCSHLCIEKCVSIGCLHWESRSVNLSRGYTENFCTKQCCHCTMNLCRCQHIHEPPCH